jgi:streptogramin lyase
LLLTLALAVSACSGGSSEFVPPPPPPKPQLRGQVLGGVTPISGAQVTVYQAGGGGYGTGNVQLATTTTDKHGRFSFPTVSCQAGPNLSQGVYLVATGGTAQGQSTPNPAIALSTAIGRCATLPASVVINEVTTIATVWSLNQFTDSSGTAIGTASTNLNGLYNAFEMMTSDGLEDPVTGLAPIFPPEGVTSPTESLYAFADILSGCVSSAVDSGECDDLFLDAKPPGGNAPTTTLEAAVDMARNPDNNVSPLFSLIPVDPPYTPLLAAPPPSWALPIEFAPSVAQFNSPYAIALDAAGNVWVADAGSNAISELDAGTGYTNGFSFGPAEAQLAFPSSIALDVNNNVWVTNFENDSISSLTAASNYTSGLNFSQESAQFDGPISIAIDAAGNIWAANFTGSGVSELTAASDYGTALNFSPAGADLASPIWVALDAASNVWLANRDGDSVSELTAASNYATGLNFAAAGASFSSPNSLALDSAANVFATNETGSSVSELTAASSYNTGLNFAPAEANFNNPLDIAVDSADNLWVVSINSNIISELTAASGYASGLSFVPSEDFLGMFAVAIDASGNVWVANNQADSVTELVGVAKPVLTPIQACLIQGSNVCLP